MEEHFREIDEEFFKENPQYKVMNQESLIRRYGGMWKYNEIIGYISLYVLGTQIRGEYYAVDSRRVVKTRKKIFKLKSLKLADEVEIPLSQTSEAIYNAVFSYINKCRKELPSKFFIDTSTFESMGKYIDWKKLMNELM